MCSNNSGGGGGCSKSGSGGSNGRSWTSSKSYFPSPFFPFDPHLSPKYLTPLYSLFERLHNQNQAHHSQSPQAL